MILLNYHIIQEKPAQLFIKYYINKCVVTQRHLKNYNDLLFKYIFSTPLNLG